VAQGLWMLAATTLSLYLTRTYEMPNITKNIEHEYKIKQIVKLMKQLSVESDEDFSFAYDNLSNFLEELLQYRLSLQKEDILWQ